MSQIVRTVRGDIPPVQLGPCDAHERLFLVTPIQPGDELTDIDDNPARLLVRAEAVKLSAFALLRRANMLTCEKGDGGGPGRADYKCVGAASVLVTC